MTDDLELLIAEMARAAAHRYQCSHATITRQIRGLVVEARAEYRGAGALYGNDNKASVASLIARPRLTPAACAADSAPAKHGRDEKALAHR